MSHILMSQTARCDDCGTEQLSDDERVFVDPHIYCVDCFDATCNRCDMSVVDAENRVQRFGEYFCQECAERLCADCGTYIDDLDDRRVVTGSVRCKECAWCFFGELCCGCGTDVSDSTEMVIANGSHQFCADCQSELPEGIPIQEYPFEQNPMESTTDSNKDAPF